MDRLQAMRVFVRVAELGSFTRAASALGLSRARVSEAVGELEQTLGARLLHRTTRHVAATDDGRAYYERCRQILSDIDDADALVARTPRGRGGVRGRLRVAMPVALARAFVVPALPAFLARHPELALEMRLNNAALHLLEDGVDCAISYGLPADESLVATRIMETQLSTCAAPSYLGKRGLPRAPAELAQHDCVAFLALDSAREAAWSFLEGGQRVSIYPRARLAFNSMEACVEAAEAGLGVTQVLSSLLDHALARGRLRVLLEEQAAPGPSIFVVYPPHREASPRLRAVLAFLREAFMQRGAIAPSEAGAPSAAGAPLDAGKRRRPAAPRRPGRRG
jgi:LysR family transcriptional regulator, regulator for bpeEF and oprC